MAHSLPCRVPANPPTVPAPNAKTWRNAVPGSSCARSETRLPTSWTTPPFRTSLVRSTPCDLPGSRRKTSCTTSKFPRERRGKGEVGSLPLGLITRGNGDRRLEVIDLDQVQVRLNQASGRIGAAAELELRGEGRSDQAAERNPHGRPEDGRADVKRERISDVLQGAGVLLWDRQRRLQVHVAGEGVVALRQCD